MKVGGHRFTGSDETIDPLQPGKQAAQRRLALDDNGSAALLDERQETAGEDAIAETLFGIDEQGPAFEGFARPSRAGKASRRRVLERRPPAALGELVGSVEQFDGVAAPDDPARDDFSAE